MLGEAFQSVKFPILPFAEKTGDKKIHLYQRNPRLMTPKDFDFSPYFEIVKYPFFSLDDISLYRHLPWANEGMYCNSPSECYIPEEMDDTNDKQNENKTPDVSVENLDNTSIDHQEKEQSINLLDKNTLSRPGESS